MPVTGSIARKRFGQHYLKDPDAIGRIVRTFAARPGDCVVEIGPGRGALTLPLLKQIGHLHAIELDRDLIAPLKHICAGQGKLTLHQADALTFDFCALQERQKLRLLGNLPYNIATPLLFHLLTQRECIQDMLFMMQKEVVERLSASPGGKTYGRLSVMVQWQCHVEPLYDIPPEAFHPKPKVMSSMVHLCPLARTQPQVKDSECFARVVAAAFSKRRKTLRNSLKGILTDEAMRAHGINPKARPEQLSIDEFAALADSVSGC